MKGKVKSQEEKSEGETVVELGASPESLVRTAEAGCAQWLRTKLGLFAQILLFCSFEVTLKRARVIPLIGGGFLGAAQLKSRVTHDYSNTHRYTHA